MSNWLWQNCPRIAHGMHRYTLHVLTTAYRSGKALINNESNVEAYLSSTPTTPILDQPDCAPFSEPLLPASHVWLLASTLPHCYTSVSCIIFFI